MTFQIRSFKQNDIGDLVQLTLLAFEPVFKSFEQILGPKIYPILYPDWQKSQAEGVEKLSSNKKINIHYLYSTVQLWNRNNKLDPYVRK